MIRVLTGATLVDGTGAKAVPGMPMQTGLVEKRASLPRKGATSPT